MSSGRVGAAGIAVAVLALAGPAASEAEGQVPGAIDYDEPAAPPTGPLTEAELVRRLESLRPQLEEAFAAHTAAARRRVLEAAARQPAVTEMVRVGPLTVAAPPEQAELAASLFGEVWSEAFEGIEGSPSLADRLFVFRWAWARAEPLAIDPRRTGHSELGRVELTRAWARTRDAAKRSIRQAIWTALRSDIPEGSRLGDWIGARRFPSAENVSRLVTGALVEANRACLAGDEGACLTALGLSGGEMSVPPETPAMVLMEAVRIGGSGAWERLLERADAEPAVALAHAAGVDAAAVAAAWRDTLLEQRPDIHAGLGGQAGRALLWFLALCALALRSTRWRIA